MNTNYENELNELKASSLSQRIRALEENGLKDTYIRKRVPSYATAAPANSSNISNGKGSFKTNQFGSSTKIYQNPSQFNSNDNNLANTSINSVSSVHSIISNNTNHNTNDRNYRANSSCDSLSGGNLDETFHENTDIVREDRIASPVNYHHIIDELNEAKSRLKKVGEPVFKSPLEFEVSPPGSQRGGLKIQTNGLLNHKTQETQPEQEAPSPNSNTSFSKATSKLLAEQLKKMNQQKTVLTENNDSASSINQIPISIPLSEPKSHTRSSSRSSATGINALIGIWSEVDKHNKLQATRNASKSLGNIFNQPIIASKNSSPSNSRLNLSHQSNNSSIRSDYNYSKHTSPRPYSNPQTVVSALKNIVNEVHTHAKLQQGSHENNSTKRSATNFNSIYSSKSQSMEEPSSSRKASTSSSQAPAPYQPFHSHKSSFESPSADNKPYVSPYTARSSALSHKNAYSSHSNDSNMLNTAPVRAASFEQLDSNSLAFNASNTAIDRARVSSGSRKSLYEDYLTSNHPSYVHNTSNNRSDSISSSNTVASSNHTVTYTNVNTNNSMNATGYSNNSFNNMDDYQSNDHDNNQNKNGRSHLVSSNIYMALIY